MTSAMCVLVELTADLLPDTWVCCVCFCKLNSYDAWKCHMSGEHMKQLVQISTSIQLESVVSTEVSSPIKLSANFHYESQAKPADFQSFPVVPASNHDLVSHSQAANCNVASPVRPAGGEICASQVYEVADDSCLYSADMDSQLSSVSDLLLEKHDVENERTKVDEHKVEETENQYHILQPSQDKCITDGKYDKLHCQFCGSDQFRSHRSLHTHLKSHAAQSQPVNCSYCPYNFTTEQTAVSLSLVSNTLTTSKKSDREIKDNAMEANMIPPNDLCSMESAKRTETGKSDVRVDGIVTASSHSSRGFSCSECSATFSRHHSYHRHLVTHLGSEQTATCSYCQKVVRARDLKSTDEPTILSGCVWFLCHGYGRYVLKSCHMLPRTSDGPCSSTVKKGAVSKGYVCSQCDFHCTQKSSYQKHLKKHHPKVKVFQCQLCEFSAQSAQGIKLHIRLTHGTSTKSCDLCPDAIYCDTEQLMSHLQRVHGVEVFDHLCRVCGRLFQHPGAFQKHQKVHESELRCRKCDFLAASVGDLASHQCGSAGIMQLNSHQLTSHTGSTLTLQCSSCTQVFSDANELQTHLRKTHHTRPEFSCNQCSCTFNRLWNLLRHKRIHHETCAEQCELCDYSTKSPRLLAKHYTNTHLVTPPARVMSAVKPTRQQSVLRHRLKKATAKVMCDVCGQVLSKGMLKIHMNSHLGLRPFRCHHKDCKFTTGSSNGLSSHIKRCHLGIKVGKKKYLKCSSCSFKTKEKIRLLQHRAKKHDIPPQTSTPSITGQTLQRFLDQSEALEAAIPDTSEELLTCDIMDGELEEIDGHVSQSDSINWPSADLCL